MTVILLSFATSVEESERNCLAGLGVSQRRPEDRLTTQHVAETEAHKLTPKCLGSKYFSLDAKDGRGVAGSD